MANAITYRIAPNIFNNASEDGTAQLPPDGTNSTWARTIAAVNNRPGAYETLDTTATSLSVLVYESRLTVSGTMAFTLPDGTYDGQEKLVRCVSAASIPAATLTVTTPETSSPYVCSSTFFFDTAGQAILFRWVGSKWRAIQVWRAGGSANNVVVGTTVLTGKNLWALYALSVTGAVASTSTKGIPNGSAIGERMVIGCSTAASIPHGDISGTFRDTLGATGATGLDDFTATTDHLLFEWIGTAWQLLSNNSTAVAIV